MPDDWLNDDDGDLGEFDQFEWNSGRETRVPIVLLLDTSSSMADKRLPAPRPIDQLNDAIQSWLVELKSDPSLRYKAEVAVITFGGDDPVSILGPDGELFRPAATLEIPHLAGRGRTPMLRAIRLALSYAADRKKQLDDEGIPRYRSLLFLVTDGFPTDEEGHFDETWPEVAGELRRLDGHVLLTCFGTESANFEVLEGLAPGLSLEINKAQFLAVLRLVSSSAGASDPVSTLKRKLRSMAARQS